MGFCCENVVDFGMFAIHCETFPLPAAIQDSTHRGNFKTAKPLEHQQRPYFDLTKLTQWQRSSQNVPGGAHVCGVRNLQASTGNLFSDFSLNGRSGNDFGSCKDHPEKNKALAKRTKAAKTGQVIERHKSHWTSPNPWSRPLSTQRGSVRAATARTCLMADFESI